MIAKFGLAEYGLFKWGYWNQFQGQMRPQRPFGGHHGLRGQKQYSQEYKGSQGCLIKSSGQIWPLRQLTISVSKDSFKTTKRVDFYFFLIFFGLYPSIEFQMSSVLSVHRSEKDIKRHNKDIFIMSFSGLTNKKHLTPRLCGLFVLSVLST